MRQILQIVYSRYIGCNHRQQQYGMFKCKWEFENKGFKDE